MTQKKQMTRREAAGRMTKTINFNFKFIKLNTNRMVRVPKLTKLMVMVMALHGTLPLARRRRK